MVKHKLLKKRLKIIARKLEVFTTAQMCVELNNFPNNEGRRHSKSPSASVDRCATLLTMDSEIAQNYKHTHGDKNKTIWEWIGEEE